MNLETFADKAPAGTISARQLDANFRKLRPLGLDGTGRQYLLTTTPDGWRLKIFPDFPAGGLHVLGTRNGVLVWVPTAECA